MNNFMKIINGSRKSKTMRWAGIFGLLWSGMLGMDWANIQLPEVVQGSPWLVLALGVAQSVMMGVKRIQTDTALKNK